MPGRGDQDSEARFAAFIEALVDIIGHVDRAAPLRDYCTGLLMPAERKSVEPIAAVTAPSRVPAQHQSLLHFIGQSAWSDGPSSPKCARSPCPLSNAADRWRRGS